jgi:hypothetical protein
MRAGMFRISEVLRLRGVDVEVRPDGILVTIDKSKTQQTEPQVVPIPFDAATAPCYHPMNFADVFRASEGRLFRDPRLLREAIKLGAAATRAQAVAFSGHSPRREAAHEARAAKAPIDAITTYGRWVHGSAEAGKYTMLEAEQAALEIDAAVTAKRLTTEPAKKLAGDKRRVRRARCRRRSSTQRRMDMRESPKHRRELLKQAVDTSVRWMKIRAEEQGLAWLDDGELPLRQSIKPR